MEGVPDTIIRKMTGHMSAVMERYKHLDSSFATQSVERIGGRIPEKNSYIFSYSPKTEAPAEKRRAQLPPFIDVSGGADGTRTRDLRRDRFKFHANKINELAYLSTSYERHITSRSDRKRPHYATSTDTHTDTRFSVEPRRDHNTSSRSHVSIAQDW
jgi:hypothetical protein